MHSLTAAGFVVAGSLLALPATRDFATNPFNPRGVQEREHISRDEAAGAAIEAIRAGDFERAREILGQELVIARLTAARAALDAGQPSRALPAIDRALGIEPQDRTALRLRAEGLLALGEDRMNSGGSFVMGTFEDAERAFEHAGREPFAWFGRARAAYLQNRAEDANKFARRGAQLLRAAATDETRPPAGEPTTDEGSAPAEGAAPIESPGATAAGDGRDPSDPPIPLMEEYRFGLAQRILADSSYLAYSEAAQALYEQTAGADPEREAELYVQTLGEVEALISVAPDRADTWLLLSNLHLYRSQATGNAQDTQRALDAARDGLDRLPGDPGLLDRLTTTARTLGGNARAVEILEAYVETDPTGPEGLTALSKARFEFGLALVPQDPTQTAGFALAREHFVAAEAGFSQAADQLTAGSQAAGEVAIWKAISISASGWMAYWSEDLELARSEFLRTEDGFPGGAQVNYADRMRSGVRGLQGLVGKYKERDRMDLARDLQDDLVKLLPEDATMWNDAGYFRREVAALLEFRARELCRAAAGEETDPQRLVELRSVAEVAKELFGTEAEKRMFRERSSILFEAAHAEMERSAEAYERAFELAPDDVVVLNDSALIYVHYLHRDLDVAEQRFLRAIELGAEILGEEVEATTTGQPAVAFGDAHENLGVLYLEHRKQPKRAQAYFERAVEFGPGPRTIVTEYYLPVCDGETPTGFARDVLSWARPCQ